MRGQDGRRESAGGVGDVLRLPAEDGQRRLYHVKPGETRALEQAPLEQQGILRRRSWQSWSEFLISSTRAHGLRG
jgi:hypothetical protein